MRTLTLQVLTGILLCGFVLPVLAQDVNEKDLETVKEYINASPGYLEVDMNRFGWILIPPLRHLVRGTVDAVFGIDPVQDRPYLLRNWGHRVQKGGYQKLRKAEEFFKKATRHFPERAPKLEDIMKHSRRLRESLAVPSSGDPWQRDYREKTWNFAISEKDFFRKVAEVGQGPYRSMALRIALATAVGLAHRVDSGRAFRILQELKFDAPENQIRITAKDYLRNKVGHLPSPVDVERVLRDMLGKAPTSAHTSLIDGLSGVTFQTGSHDRETILRNLTNNPPRSRSGVGRSNAGLRAAPIRLRNTIRR